MHSDMMPCRQGHRTSASHQVNPKDHPWFLQLLWLGPTVHINTSPAGVTATTCVPTLMPTLLSNILQGDMADVPQLDMAQHIHETEQEALCNKCKCNKHKGVECKQNDCKQVDCKCVEREHVEHAMALRTEAGNKFRKVEISQHNFLVVRYANDLELGT